MNEMNNAIREAVRIGLARNNWRQNDLAEATGLSEQHISQLMRARSGNIPEAWQKIFDALELEIVARPKAK